MSARTELHLEADFRPPGEDYRALVARIDGPKMEASLDQMERNRPHYDSAFAALGAIATGVIGTDPDLSNGFIETLPRLTNAVEWARLTRVPVGANEITVEHRGTISTSFSNQSGPPVQWRPVFQSNGKRIAQAAMTIHGGETRTAKLA